MSQSTGPKFNCPSCGKEYTWKPQLAGKKGKCKCGSVMLVPAKAPEAKVPEPEEDIFDMADHGSGEEDAPLAPPPYSAGAAAVAAPPPYTPAVASAGAGASAKADSSGGRELKWAPASKWLGIGALAVVLALWELSSPTDPDAIRVRKWQLLFVLANKIHPMGAFFLLAAFAAFMIVVGVLILLGKAKDSDYEHEQQQGKWPSSRGRR